MLDSLEPSHLDPDSPKDVMKWMKKLGREMGDEAGDDFADEMEGALEEETAAEGETGEAGAGERDELF